MAYKFVANGHPAGTKLLDQETGENVTARFGARSFIVKCEAGEPQILEVELLVHVKAENMPPPEYYAVNPRTGRTQKLASLTFADGTTVDLSLPLAQLFGFQQAGGAKFD